MENNTTIINRVGPSLTTLLTGLFITLKLIGLISWSWWWVLSPVWISFALVAILLVIATICLAIGKSALN